MQAVNKSQMEAGIRAYQLVTDILRNLTSENQTLMAEVKQATAILNDVLLVLVDDYAAQFPAPKPIELAAPAKKSRKKA